MTQWRARKFLARRLHLALNPGYEGSEKIGAIIFRVEGPDRPLAESAAHAEQAWITRLPLPLREHVDGALAGLMFAVKDNIDVAGMPTTAACPAFSYEPVVHAEVVHKLLLAGAAVVGKTNLDQFACGLSGTRSPHGPVPNAFDPSFVCGGSSSGSAYAVATGQVNFALGTDTAGSGRVPAGLNNIVGLKPSKGLISTRGVVPAAQSVDCVSIFAGSVGVAAEVLNAAMGFDALDPFSRELTLAHEPFPAAFSFGIPAAPDFFGDVQARDAFIEAVARLRGLGGTPVTVDFAPLAQAGELLYGSALVAERYAAIRPFFDANEAAVSEPVRSIIANGRRYSAADLLQAQLTLRTLGRQGATIWLQVDVLVVPTAPTHYTIAAMQADPVALNRNLGAYTSFVNLLDFAALSVPSSIRPDGLPFGITLIGPCASDWQLADLGQRYHHATGLTQGATGRPLPDPVPVPGLRGSQRLKVAVVGAHLSGMPLNGQLTGCGARLLATARTTADYRLFVLPGSSPPKPGLQRVAESTGHSIALEVWELPPERYGSFVALVPSPLCIGTLRLDDGSQVQGFLCEAAAIEGAEDISHFGGWRAWITSHPEFGPNANANANM